MLTRNVTVSGPIGIIAQQIMAKALSELLPDPMSQSPPPAARAQRIEAHRRNGEFPFNFAGK